MNIVPLTSQSIAELRLKRTKFVQDMIQDQEGVLLVLGGAFAGENRQHQAISYAVTTIFFELYERYTFDFWTYTFDAEGLMYYIRIDGDAQAIKNTMIHYEDYHPLGFAITSHVYTSDKQWTRDMLNVKERKDFYYKKPLEEILDEIQQDNKYESTFVKNVEEQIIKTDKQSALSNILVYGYITSITKPYGFGLYGPNQRGTDKSMNFKNFILLLRTYKNEMRKILTVNTSNYLDIRRFQKDVESKIQLALFTQMPFYYSVHMSSLVLFGFMKSAGYQDIGTQVKILSESFDKKHSKQEDSARYDIARTGFKEIVSHYVPYYNSSQSPMSTMLYIMSRYKDVSICMDSGEQSLLKMQFLAKNLMNKKDKWVELEKFAVSNGVYPQDTTTMLANTVMMDLIQRNYIKIKMLFN